MTEHKLSKEFDYNAEFCTLSKNFVNSWVVVGNYNQYSAPKIWSKHENNDKTLVINIFV